MLFNLINALLIEHQLGLISQASLKTTNIENGSTRSADNKRQQILTIKKGSN